MVEDEHCRFFSLALGYILMVLENLLVKLECSGVLAGHLQRPGQFQGNVNVLGVLVGCLPEKPRSL